MTIAAIAVIEAGRTKRARRKQSALPAAVTERLFAAMRDAARELHTARNLTNSDDARHALDGAIVYLAKARHYLGDGAAQ